MVQRELAEVGMEGRDTKGKGAVDDRDKYAIIYIADPRDLDEGGDNIMRESVLWAEVLGIGTSGNGKDGGGVGPHGDARIWRKQDVLTNEEGAGVQDEEDKVHPSPPLPPRQRAKTQ